MKFNLIINTNNKETLNLNNLEFTIKDIQKNRLDKNTIENKINIIFKNLDSYKRNGEVIISSNINSIKLIDSDGTVVFERNELNQERISLFSNITQDEINMNIIIFDHL